jgi:zinc protease
VLGSVDPGLLVISGRLKSGISTRQGEEEVSRVISELLAKGLAPDELQKVKNQAETALEFDEVEVMNRAMSLAFSSLSGDANHVNFEKELVNKVSLEEIMEMGRTILNEKNLSVMHYRSKAEAA